MKNYVLELKESDFEKMAKELEAISRKLPFVEDLILKALAEYTLDRVVYHITTTVGQTGYEGTDTLVNSITTSEIFNHTIRVYTDLAYAKFVEYGTGVVGSNSPHPEPDGWNYDVNGHGDEGWYYTDENGDKRFTKGQVAHKFMYNAFQDLRQNYMRIAKEVLRKEGII